MISALERQLMVETADREKAETGYARQIEELEIRRDEELGPLKEKHITEEEQVTLGAHYYHIICTFITVQYKTRARLSYNLMCDAVVVVRKTTKRLKREVGINWVCTYYNLVMSTYHIQSKMLTAGS